MGAFSFEHCITIQRGEANNPCDVMTVFAMSDVAGQKRSSAGRGLLLPYGQGQQC